MHHPKQPLVRRLLPAIFLMANAEASPNNFCGNDWNDASTDCQNRQPCPDGTDDECDSGICWADTLCDTNKGDGILFDKDNPQHQRFCGNSWNDAADNCSADRHCGSGDSSECKDGEACYSFLSGCNYVDMIVGSIGNGNGNEDDSDGPTRLDANSPMRSNWCGSDWNDAIAHCTDTSHWCPSGSDSDCPAGKVCYAGTDCMFRDDLHPTESPTPAPSITPTHSPLVYNTIENTRFCGTGWEDAQNFCQISRHCPTGRNSECKSGMTCYSWMSGCNIIDMNDYLDNYGVEIYGKDRLEMTPSGESGGTSNGSGDNSRESSSSSSTAYERPEADADDQTSGVSPSLSLGVWTPQPAPIDRTPPPRWTAAPIEPNPSMSPAGPPADGHYPEHHVFCGESWIGAQANCSPETFCSNGASTHVCEGENEYCWVGITACDAGDWLLAKETTAPIAMSTSSPTPTPIIPSTPAPTASPIESATIDSAGIDELAVTFPTFEPTITAIEITTNAPIATTIISNDDTSIPNESDTLNELDRYSMKQSFCAENYIHLIQECSILQTCNKSPCRDGLTCFKNVLCDEPANVDIEPATNDEIIETPAPIASEPDTPIPSTSPVIETESPVTQRPTLSPQTRSPTQQPTSFVLSEAEVAQRMSNPNNYCAKNLQEILVSCSYSLMTCNEGEICPVDTYCFGNVVCPSPTNAPTTDFPVISTIEPVDVVIDGETTVNPAAQSYCAENEDTIQLTCATAFSCDEGSHTCPIGTSCFSNVVCEDLQNEKASSDSLPSWNIETPTTIASQPESSESNTFGNYCAENEAMIQSSCAEAVTCNMGFGSCPLGSYCFSNVLCEALQTASLHSEECTDLCLKPVDSSDCDYILSIGLTILPCSGMSASYERETGTDQVCAGTGVCGTSIDLNNCGNEDLYMRVDVSDCMEAGLGRSGVLLLDLSQSAATDAIMEATEAPTTTISESSDVNDLSTLKPTMRPVEIVYSWEDPAKNNTRENQGEIDSWWIMEESGASLMHHTTYVLTVMLVLIIK